MEVSYAIEIIMRSGVPTKDNKFNQYNLLLHDAVMTLVEYHSNPLPPKPEQKPPPSMQELTKTLGDVQYECRKFQSLAEWSEGKIEVLKLRNTKLRAKIRQLNNEIKGMIR